MAAIESNIVIDRAIEEVFAFVVDIGNEAKWQSGITEAAFTSPGPIGVGSTSREVRNFMGRTMEATYRITEFDENETCGFESTSGPIPVHGAYTFESVEKGTKVGLELDPDVAGFLKVLGPMIISMGKRQIDADFGHLKDLLEGTGQED